MSRSDTLRAVLFIGLLALTLIVGGVLVTP